MNEILYRKRSLVKQCVLINEFLNKGELSTNCLFIGMDDTDINSQCLSNKKDSFYEALSPKKHVQVSFDKKGYQDAVLVSFTTIFTVIAT